MGIPWGSLEMHNLVPDPSPLPQNLPLNKLPADWNAHYKFEKHSFRSCLGELFLKVLLISGVNFDLLRLAPLWLLGVRMLIGASNRYWEVITDGPLGFQPRGELSSLGALDRSSGGRMLFAYTSQSIFRVFIV